MGQPLNFGPTQPFVCSMSGVEVIAIGDKFDYIGKVL